MKNFTYDGIIEKESLCDDHPILNYLKSNYINSFKYSYIRISGSSNIWASIINDLCKDLDEIPQKLIFISNIIDPYNRFAFCFYIEENNSCYYVEMSKHYIKYFHDPYKSLIQNYILLE